jgi:hypothetical protein
MVEQPQANPKPHPIDFLALLFVAIGAGAEMSDMLPAKFSGVLVALAVFARLYTKWIGSQQQRDALVEGKQAGVELKIDLEQIRAVKAEPVATLQK